MQFSMKRTVFQLTSVQKGLIRIIQAVIKRFMCKFWKHVTMYFEEHALPKLEKGLTKSYLLKHYSMKSGVWGYTRAKLASHPSPSMASPVLRWDKEDHFEANNLPVRGVKIF